MSPQVQTLLVNLSVLVAVMLVLWIAGTRRRDASLVDPFWGTGFVLVAWIARSLNEPTSSRVLLLSILTTVWGLRLSIYLLWRNWGRGEDHRYAAMRANHGNRFWWVSLFSVFLLQGGLLWIISLPIQVAAANDMGTPLGWLDGIGIGLWAVGMYFEALGDWQLTKFQRDLRNRGQVLDRGLWRFTRHPNYFGDFCVWWGLYLIAAAGGAGWTIGSPLLMSLLLMRISGVTLLESTILERRPDYAAYKSRTNAFFPGPRRG
jgi:steroid 5-alpha reductase family enzyme